MNTLSNNNIGIAYEADPKDEDQLLRLHLVTNEEELTKAERTPLSKKEKEDLAEFVELIHDNLDAVESVSASLHEIKERKLYRETHSSFAKFCQDTFKISRSHAYRLTEEHEVRENFKGASAKETAIPTGTGQTREVVGFKPAEQLAIGKRVKEIAGNKSATAKHWNQAKTELIEEGEIQTPPKARQPVAAKISTPTENNLVWKILDGEPRSPIDPKLVSLKTLKEKAEEHESLAGTSKTIVRKSRLFQEIKIGLQQWAVKEEAYSVRKEAA